MVPTPSATTRPAVVRIGDVVPLPAPTPPASRPAADSTPGTGWWIILGSFLLFVVSMFGWRFRHFVGPSPRPLSTQARQLTEPRDSPTAEVSWAGEATVYVTNRRWHRARTLRVSAGLPPSSG